MSVHYDNDNNKIIEAEDTATGLSDAIADMMLLCGGDNAALEEAIESAKGSAELHYDAEKGGYSEGFTVLVDPQDGSDVVTLAEWVAAHPSPDEEDDEEVERYTVAPSGPGWIVLDGGAPLSGGSIEYDSEEKANEEAERLNATD
jgi:hypothetical protein